MGRKYVVSAPLLLALVGCGASPTTSALTLPTPHDDAGGAARRGDGGGGVLEAAAAAPDARDAGAELQAAGDAGAEAAPDALPIFNASAATGCYGQSLWSPALCGGTDCAHLICTDDSITPGRTVQVVAPDCPIQRGGCPAAGVCVLACP